MVLKSHFILRVFPLRYGNERVEAQIDPLREAVDSVEKAEEAAGRQFAIRWCVAAFILGGVCETAAC